MVNVLLLARHRKSALFYVLSDDLRAKVGLPSVSIVAHSVTREFWVITEPDDLLLGIS